MTNSNRITSILLQ